MPNLYKILNSYKGDFLADAELLESMRSVYPGDSDGRLGAEAFVLQCIVDTIDEIDWEPIFKKYERDYVEVTVTHV